MVDNPKDVEKSRRLFASAVKFREGAEAVMSNGNEYAGCAASLCHQSAMLMMAAFIQLKDRTVGLTAELEPISIWGICTSLHEELDDADDEVQTLLDCEWAGYLPKPGQKETDVKYAREAIQCAKKLEQAMLEAAPGLMLQKRE